MEQSIVPLRANPLHCITSATFEKQPPDNMRKSNFFHFIISLYDSQQHRIQVQKAIFKDFYDTSVDGQEYRNGLIYKLLVVYKDGIQKEEELYVRLIDSATKQMVPYEGTNKNPDFRRVLLTHELICSRCLERRSCGNKNDTPSDPIILDNFRLKIFAKCNQNCLKNAGNPKDSRRRFQVAIYPLDLLEESPIACSDSMFVHNNSKHGRRPIYRDSVVGDGKPCILSVYPSEGWTTGGTRVTVIGLNFFEGLDVVFATVPVPSEVLSPNAIAVRAPPATMAGEVDITLIFRVSGAQFCVNNPGKFIYTAPEDQCFENSFCRIERVIRQQDDPDELPKDIVLQRAAELLEVGYGGTRGHFPFSQGPILPYPRSPALFGSNGVFLFTPQPLTPRLGSNGGMVPLGDGQSATFGSYMQPVGGTLDGFQRQGYNQQTAFPFPDIGGPSGSLPGEVKSESQLSSPGQGLHKSQTNGSMLMPFIPMNQPGFDGSTFPASVPLNHGQTNSNNNNSTASVTDSTSIATSSQMSTNSLSYMSRLFPGGVPQSPGFLMAHSFSPLQLPNTPTGLGGTTMFNFNTPLLSPTKSRPPKAARLTPLTVPTCSDNSTTGAPIPSPQLGTFTFPPITPTALIAPITLPDLIQDPPSENSTTLSSAPSSSSSLPHTPSRKRKIDESPVEV